MSDNIKSNIKAFKRKFYLNKLIRGTLLSTILFASILLIFSSLEGFLWFGKAVRIIFLGILSGSFLLALVWGVIIPLSGLFSLRKGISDERAALEVGNHFPEVRDKLLNYLQLQKLNSSERSLVNAALLQKTEQLKVVPFQKAINLKANIKYAYIFISVIVFISMVSFISPGFISEGSSRIIQFNKEFVRPAPFQFIVQDNLTAFKNESYELTVAIEGDYLPKDVFLLENNRRIRLNNIGQNEYKFMYPSISSTKEFQLEAAGFRSEIHTITVHERPEILNFQVDVDFPAYTQMEDKIVKNTGSLIVPEGSKLTWTLNTSNAEGVYFKSKDQTEPFSNSSDSYFEYKKQINRELRYELSLRNKFAENKSRIAYEISVIKDQHPEIEVEFIPDTITYKSILISGNIADDYGFRSLGISYRIKNAGPFTRINLPVQSTENNQQFFYQWELDSLDIQEDMGIQLFVSVKDNDAINGYKESRSSTFYFNIPNKEEQEQMVESAGKKAQAQFDETTRTSETLNEKLEELEDRLKNKKDLSWQDEKLLKDAIEEKEELRNSLEELKKQHEELLRSQKEFGTQSQKSQKKSEQLQQLIDESMDDKTRELYEELQKLLQEKGGTDKILEKLSNVRNKEQNLERELERMKELFNRLKFETKLEQQAKEIEELAERQQELAEKTQDEAGQTPENDSKKSTEDQKNTSESEEETANNKNEDSDSQEQSNEQQQKNERSLEEQEKITEAFKEFEEKLEELEKLNQELKKPEALEDFNSDQKEINEKLDEITENLQKGNNQKAGHQMKTAGERMKSMAQKMGQMQSSMEMTVMQENIDHLRDILDNLIKISFEQEKLITAFQGVQQVDPRFIELSQEQLKLIDNSDVIQDSLLSLAGRVVQISNFVTREINEINVSLEKAMKELKERNKNKATSHQQFAMTSMNNLSLLLDDVLSQMQMAMSEAMGRPQKAGQKQGEMPDMKQLQQQLSEQIKDLKKSGKSGRQLSEELARLAAEQANIRQQMEEMKDQLAGQPKSGEEGEGGAGGDALKQAIEQMEENEVDLVNKQLTQELIDRQQQIVTRMLEAEESMREQKESPEREGETANNTSRKVPPEFEEYLKAKRSELELLKTIPLELNPFYKKEVNNYFRRLAGQEEQ